MVCFLATPRQSTGCTSQVYMGSMATGLSSISPHNISNFCSIVYQQYIRTWCASFEFQHLFYLLTTCSNEDVKINVCTLAVASVNSPDVIAAAVNTPDTHAAAAVNTPAPAAVVNTPGAVVNTPAVN